MLEGYWSKRICSFVNQKHFHVSTTFIDSKTGGLITFVRKSIFPNSVMLEPAVFSDGRILRTEVTDGEFSIVIFNVHFYKIPNYQIFSRWTTS